MENTLRKFCLYRHTSPVGKVYIGITSTKPTARWGLYGQRYKDNTYFKNAILKYGWDNFKHEILFTNLTEERAKHLEIELIRHYKSLGICYNISAGGDGCSKPVSEETKKKLSKSLKGHRSYERTTEWRKAKSEQVKAHPISTKEGLEKAHKRCAELLSKSIVQLDKHMSIIAVYKSIREASRITGYDTSYIAKCCKGLYKDAYGYIWEYSDILDEGTREHIINH